jgi:putative drug exporter of the RND superfamily
VTVNGQTAGIALILVFGAGTDYALLLVARYREELRRTESTYQAMRIALAGAAPAIIASAGTVIAALLVVTLAEVNSTAGLGPLSAVGVGLAMTASLQLPSPPVRQTTAPARPIRVACNQTPDTTPAGRSPRPDHPRARDE